jgi:alkylation response protein AidB-like acyl-CoA dehydrogenase
MKLSFDPADEAFRAALVSFLDAHVPKEIGGGRDWIGDDDDVDDDGIMVIPAWARDWQATLFDHGWMIPAYPPELGGRNATPTQTLVYLEEMARLGVPRSVHFGGYAIVGPSLLEFGNEQQKAMAPAAIRGDTIWCIGMSEPNAGSDLAGLQTRAEVYDDHFVVNGQKVWTSYAMIAQKCFCYVRTDPTLPKHKGISLLILDMDTPGIDIRPLRHINGTAGFAEVFFDDVIVPRSGLMGELNGGWAITQGSLAHERAGLWVVGVARFELTIEGLITLAREQGRADDPIIRRKIAQFHELASSLRALGYKGFASFAQGSSAPEHSYMKMATSEAGKAAYELGMEILGPMAPVTDATLADVNRWSHGFFMSFANTIAGGSSEIQRNIIAQRVLGLPRA